MRTPFFNTLTTRQLCLFGAVLSLVFSIASILRNEVLSYDSLLYLETARTYLESGLQAAVTVYPWPFLSMLIGAVHQATGLSLVASGHALITLFYAAITCTFILLVRDLGGNSRTQLIAVLILLIFPTFNDYRAYIIRDPGFWFFALLSLQQIMRFARNHSSITAMGWVASVSLAIAFRTESLFIAALTPLALLLQRDSLMQERIKRLCLIYLLMLAAAAFVTVGILTTTAVAADKLRLFVELMNLPEFFVQLSGDLSATIHQLSATVANSYTADDMEVIYLSGLVGLLLVTSLHALTTPFLALYLWQRRSYWAIICSSQIIHIIAYLLSIICYLCLFTFKQQFVTDRFFVLFALILLLPLPFALESILFNPRAGRFTWQKMLVGLLLLYQLLDSCISTGASKAYIASAAQWIQLHNDTGSAVTSNQEHIGYFAGHSLAKSFKHNALELVEANQLENGEIVALRVRHRQKERMARVLKLQQDGMLTPLKSFANEKQDSLLIFKFRRSEQN